MVTKDELMKMAMLDFMVQDEFAATATQINSICGNISQLVQNKIVSIYIDECWITIPKKFEAHVTKVGYLITQDILLIDLDILRPTQMRLWDTSPLSRMAHSTPGLCWTLARFSSRWQSCLTVNTCWRRI